MKLPDAYKSVTLCPGNYDVPYPPLGFCPIAEHQLGNGDTFGLYWPIGEEDRDPIVAETYHDQWSIQPHFSSLNRFLAAAAKSENADDEYSDGTYPGTPLFGEDPQSPRACLLAAQEHMKTQQADLAIRCLETAVSVLPEYTAAQAILCTQYRRVGRHDSAVKSAIQAIISPPCFGAPHTQVANWLSRQSLCAEESKADPIWINRQQLTLKFGGLKENDDYNILRAAIDYYIENAAFVPAMTLMQTYAQFMYSETVSFRERYGFVARGFVSWQREVAASQYGRSRVIEL